MLIDDFKKWRKTNTRDLTVEIFYICENITEKIISINVKCDLVAFEKLNEREKKFHPKNQKSGILQDGQTWNNEIDRFWVSTIVLDSKWRSNESS